MSEAKRLDQTEPGGKYLNVTQDRWIDANGKDLGPVEPVGDPSEAEIDETSTEDLELGGDEAAIDAGANESDGAEPNEPEAEKPTKRPRSPKAAD